MHVNILPNYAITDIHLDFQVEMRGRIVVATSHVISKSHQVEDFVLNGQSMILRTIEINNIAWTDYTQTETQVVIHNTAENPLPAEFTLVIVTELDPLTSMVLGGMYQSSATKITSSEAEKLTKITYYSYHSDVQASYTTNIVFRLGKTR